MLHAGLLAWLVKACVLGCKVLVSCTFIANWPLSSEPQEYTPKDKLCWSILARIVKKVAATGSTPGVSGDIHSAMAVRLS
eukprot:6489616-Amphidinium_carterae.1